MPLNIWYELASGSVSQRYGSEDPDPYRTKMSRIPNTGYF